MHLRSTKNRILKIKTLLKSIVVVGLCLSILKVNAQSSKMTEFYALFDEISFESLYVYSDGRVTSEYDETSSYPFKGRKLDTSYFQLLAPHILPVGDSFDQINLYSISKFKISPNYEALLVREFDQVSDSRIHLLLYVPKSNKIVQSQELMFGFGSEGSFGIKESWITKLNNDQYLDIFTNSEENYISAGDNDAYNELNLDTTTVRIWNQNEFVQMEIKDSLLLVELKNDFPLNKSPQLDSVRLKLEQVIYEGLHVKDLDNRTNEELILECPKYFRTEVLNMLQHERTSWKNVKNPLIVTFEGGDFGDYFHLMFEDKEGVEYDFGFGNNIFGNGYLEYELFDQGDENVDNEKYLGKKFEVFWDWKRTTIPCCSGDYEPVKLYFPSIIKLELID